MTKNIETADRILKLTLSGTVLICYAIGVMSGPLAVVLLILATTVLASSLLQVFFSWMWAD